MFICKLDPDLNLVSLAETGIRDGDHDMCDDHVFIRQHLRVNKTPKITFTTHGTRFKC